MNSRSSEGAGKPRDAVCSAIFVSTEHNPARRCVERREFRVFQRPRVHFGLCDATFERYPGDSLAWRGPVGKWRFRSPATPPPPTPPKPPPRWIILTSSRAWRHERIKLPAVLFGNHMNSMPPEPDVLAFACYSLYRRSHFASPVRIADAECREFTTRSSRSSSPPMAPPAAAVLKKPAPRPFFTLLPQLIFVSKRKDPYRRSSRKRSTYHR